MYALVSYRNSLGITFLYLLRNVKEYLISTMNKKVVTRGDSNADKCVPRLKTDNINYKCVPRLKTDNVNYKCVPRLLRLVLTEQTTRGLGTNL
jgi:phosphoribulokinase